MTITEERVPVRTAPRRSVTTPGSPQLTPRRPGGGRPGDRRRSRPPVASRPYRSPARRPARAPFVLLIVGLLGGALVSLLLLNTVLARDSFRVTQLNRDTAMLVQQQQKLEEEISRAESPYELARRAESLGMVRGGPPAFRDTRPGSAKTGGDRR